MTRPRRGFQKMRALSPRVDRYLWAKAGKNDRVGTPWGEAEDDDTIERDIRSVVSGRLGLDGSDGEDPL